MLKIYCIENLHGSLSNSQSGLFSKEDKYFLIYACIFVNVKWFIILCRILKSKEKNGIISVRAKLTALWA